MQFYKENQNKILVEIINSDMINYQMFADITQSLNIIKDINNGNRIVIYQK